MKKNVGKKIRLMALLASLTLVLWGGVIACSSDSGDDDEDTNKITNPEPEDTTTNTLPKDGTFVKDFSLSSITSTAPGVTVLEGSKLSALAESNTITVAITCKSWNTTDGSKDTWYCYTIDGETYKGDFEWADGQPAATITGADITTLKSGSLTIYGNNTDATVTVTYK